MKIIFVHHAHRAVGNPPCRDDDLTELGYEDAKLNAKLLKQIDVKAFYTSPYFRCRRTADILNAGRNLPVFEDDRLNEFGMMKLDNQKETWVDLQTRIMQTVKDIVYKYSEDDKVIVVTSGVNVVGFLNLVYGVKQSKKAPFIGIPSCSPLIFDIDKSHFKRVKL